MEDLFQENDIAFTQAFIELGISVDAESEDLKASFLASIKGREDELIAAFLASKAKALPIGCDKFKDDAETGKASPKSGKKMQE